MTKKRVDVLLVDRGLAESRTQAQRLVMAGQVRAAGQVVPKPSTQVDVQIDLQVDQGPPFVSRGGEKLQGALQRFDLEIEERICADVGASTGGFSDCLLNAGAARVYAIDVGHGILHWKLRQDERVIVMERTNARYLERLTEAVHLVVIDVSFISLKLILPVVKNWFVSEGGDVIALIKPQFEAGRAEAARGSGVITDPAVHRKVLQDVLAFALQEGYGVRGLIASPLQGAKGNTEFLAWLEYPGHLGQNPAALIETVMG